MLIFRVRFGHTAGLSRNPLQLQNWPARFKLQLLAGLLVLMTFTPPASAAPNRLTIASAFATRLPELGSQGVEFTRRINKKLGRQLSVTLYDPGKLAPPGRYLDPVIVGAISAAWSAPNLLINKNSTFGVFGGPPFGLPAADHMRWLAGLASIAYTAAYDAIGLAAIPCGVIAGQAFAWTQEPLKALDDLKAMRIGIVSPGLSAHVLRSAGAQVRASSPAALHVMALSGALNAVSLGPYHVDLRMRTHQVARYAYAPNPLAPTYVLDLIFGLKRWQELSDNARAAIRTSCDETIQTALTRQATAKTTSLKRLAEDAKSLEPIPLPIAIHLFETWRSTAEKLAAANPGFAAAIADYPWPKGLER